MPSEMCWRKDSDHWFQPGPAAKRPGARAVGCNGVLDSIEYIVDDLEAFAKALAKDSMLGYCFVDVPIGHPAIYPPDPAWAASDAYYLAVQAEVHRQAAAYGLSC